MNTSIDGSRFAGLLLLLGALCAGCRKPAPSPAVSPSPSPPQQQQRATSPDGAPVRYTFSSADSKISFHDAATTAERTGRLERFTGVIVVAAGSTVPSSLSLDIDMTSVPAFVQHPRARFVSTAVMSGGALGATNTVVGDLELHGVTRSVSVPATVHARPGEVDIDAEVTIAAGDFGLGSPRRRPSPRSGADVIVVEVDIHALRVP